jgi:murein DD-endopeptidase
MKINWDALLRTDRARFEAMSEREKFQDFLLFQFASPYGWGKENPEESDCSGAVCMALYAATGCLVRTTADELYRKIFLIKNPFPDDIQAAFWIAPEARRHGGATVAPGTATHVAGIVGRGNVVLSSEEPKALVSTVSAVPAMGRRVEIRGLDREALAGADGKLVYGLDPDFFTFFQKE